MGKRKVTTADEMLPEPLLIPEPVVVNIAPEIDVIIAKVRAIDSVGHMYYVRKAQAEVLVLLQALRNSV